MTLFTRRTQYYCELNRHRQGKRGVYTLHDNANGLLHQSNNYYIVLSLCLCSTISEFSSQKTSTQSWTHGVTFLPSISSLTTMWQTTIFIVSLFFEPISEWKVFLNPKLVPISTWSSCFEKKTVLGFRYFPFCFTTLR